MGLGGFQFLPCIKIFLSSFQFSIKVRLRGQNMTLVKNLRNRYRFGDFVKQNGPFCIKVVVLDRK